ncbi:MAG: DNA polymerase III subunit beta [Bacilli bacterium]|nr:DNA polymerase III subunit beta [Bacilli bacterium]
MRFTINREQLLKGLNIAMKAVNPKPALPHLANVKMSLNEKGLELTGIDSFITIRTVVPYMIGEQQVISNYKYGDTLTNCRLFVEIIKHMEGANVTIELIDSSILKINDERSNFKLNAMSADEFPDVDLSLNGAKLEIATEDLVALVDQTAFAAATKHPYLTAVNLKVKNNLFVATATDTARLAHKEVTVDSDVEFVANIQAKNLVEIVRSFEGAKTVTMAVTDKRVLFDFDNTIISTTLINVNYPDTTNVLPRMFNFTLEVNSKELLSTMERVSLLSAEHDVVKLVMTEDEIEVFSRSSTNGSANEKIQTFQYSGERLEISFHAQFVADAVKALKSEDVRISFVGDRRPFVIKSCNDDTIYMIVTPLRS